MTIPDENTTTNDGVTATSGPAISTEDLGSDWTCDLDGARLEVDGKRTVGEATYQVRTCSANPSHLKMIPA